MTAAVEVRLVPALAPPSRDELPPIAVDAAGSPPVAADPDAPPPDPAAAHPVGAAPPAITVPTPWVPGTSRRRPVRSRAAQAAESIACLPVPERFGSSTLATYRHGPPPTLTAATEDGPSVARRPSSPPVLAPRTANALDARQACCMVALAAVEVLTGTRPIAQLARWVTPDVYDALARRAALTAPRTRVLDPAASAGDLREADPPRGRGARRCAGCGRARSTSTRSRRRSSSRTPGGSGPWPCG